MQWLNPDWFIRTLTKNYFNATGRASRSEYWAFYLWALIISVVLGEIDALVIKTIIPWISVVFLLALMIPTICLQIRRLHDTDTTGWCVLLCFIPLIGTLAVLIIGILGGTPGDSRFGAVPATSTKS